MIERLEEIEIPSKSRNSGISEFLSERLQLALPKTAPYNPALQLTAPRATLADCSAIPGAAVAVVTQPSRENATAARVGIGQITSCGWGLIGA